MTFQRHICCRRRDLRIAVYLVLSLCILPLLTGGCSTTKTTTTRTVASDGSSAGTDQTAAADHGSGGSTTVVKEETTVQKSDGGIFGGTFNLIGEVLAFPFKVIAGIFEAVF